MSNSTIFDDHEKYETYENTAKQKYKTRAQRRGPKRKKRGENYSQQQQYEQIAETLGLEKGFSLTYTSSQHELIWIMGPLKPFFEHEQITDVLRLIKGGKEANVYTCAAHDSLDTSLLAAKVYRPRMFRNLRNDQMYRAGRSTLTAQGDVVRANDKRTMKALNHKSNFGAYLAHQSWMAYEYLVLELLHELGAPVPAPIAKSDNAILMQFLGDENGSAPILHSVNLRKTRSPADVRVLFDKIIDTIDLMLQHDLLHGDLSAYNILYWQDDVWLIDFPQAVEASSNPDARFILQRDVQRVCDYFQRHGLYCKPRAIADALWHRYLAIPEAERQADLSQRLHNVNADHLEDD